MNSNEYITHDEIRQRAHQLWEQGGRADGQDTAHWLQAEAELRADRERGQSGNGSDGTSPSRGSPSKEASKIARKGEPLSAAGRRERSPKQENL